MKRYFLFIILFLIVLGSHGQQEPAAFAIDEQFTLWNFQKSDTAYVFAEVAYVRDQPNLQAPIVDSLSQATPVTIMSEAYYGSTVRGFYAPWQEINYEKDNQRRKGYIWIGLLALIKNTSQNGEIFIYGLKRYPPSSEYSSQYYDTELKVFNNQMELIAKESFHAQVDGQTGVQAKVLPPMGLKNIQNIYRIAFLSEACGIPTLYYYYVWNGTKLIRFPDRMSVSDAGVFFIDEQILFPSEHQDDPSIIFKNRTVGENSDIDDAQDPVYEETVNQQLYSWDGYELREIITMQ